MSLPELPVSPDRAETSASAVGDRSSAQARVAFVLVCAAAGAVLAIPAGWVWSIVADPPEGVVFDGQVFYDELQLDMQAGLTLWFIVVAVLFGVAAGLVVGLIGHRHGVVTVVAVLALCSVMSWLMAVLGIHVFGPDEAAQMAAAEQGGEITGGLEVATWVAYLAGPIGGLVGVLASIAGWPREHHEAATTP